MAVMFESVVRPDTLRDWDTNADPDTSRALNGVLPIPRRIFAISPWRKGRPLVVE